MLGRVIEWSARNGFLVILATVPLVVAGVVWLVRSLSDRSGSQDTARQLLDNRFAAGEISVEEYQDHRRTLR